jgi:hypothetical protein
MFTIIADNWKRTNFPSKIQRNDGVPQKMSNYFERILDTLDSDTIDTLWVIGDFMACVIGVMACFIQGASGSTFLVPNYIWWILTVFLAISLVRAIGEMADFCDVEGYEEILDDPSGGDE